MTDYCRYCEVGVPATPSAVKPGGFVHIVDASRVVCPPFHPDPEIDAEVRRDVADAEKENARG